MRVKVRRHLNQWQEFEIDVRGKLTLLELLNRIKEDLDPSLTFRSMCRSGVCGTCAVKLSGKHVLACSTWIFQEQEITVEPIDGYEVIRDLVVDQGQVHQMLREAGVWLKPYEANAKAKWENSRSWDCILCGVCDSVCPVLKTPSSFGGPLALTRIHKHLLDQRNADRQSTLNSLLTLKPGLCTHCMNCSYACPKMLMPEALIKEEENVLIMEGLIQKRSIGFDFLNF
ncbi:MAG: 2Fe-2S iron-sulfur cluster-binding protein [Aquificaceae bacterium]|nr:2Fe-2S iron-sulfur cluster-binding protein [Aquificaceae bacterium]MDW8433941.1 2Fe-2S iron-sulfur cluster-binding protein [Aquificaceae bacterium]